MRTATFALFIGLAYLSAGLLGLVPDALLPPPADAPPTTFTMMYGYLLGLFPVNILHSAAHLAIGALGVAAWQADHVWHRMTSPKMFARALAILYGALAVMGLIPGVNTLFGMLPLHGHDVWLHLGTAALAAYFGWRSEVLVEHRAMPDRRDEAQPVARERRVGHADRRAPGSEV
jgi:membrane associated rhomboid family serine protease